MAFDQADTCRKDGWEGEKEATDAGTKVHRNQTCQNSSQTPKDEAHRIFMGLAFFQGRKLNFNLLHRRSPMRNHSPSETANQIGNKVIVATSAGGL